MNYNDFPILNDDTYNYLKNKYSELNSEQTFDRVTSINKICFYLNECAGSCKSLKNKLNVKLSNFIEFASDEINKIISSLNETFNINLNSNIIKEFNLFTFLKYLTYAIELFINWSYKEEKEYYKKVCNNCLNSLIECVKKIMEALENSNISLYKYM